MAQCLSRNFLQWRNNCGGLNASRIFLDKGFQDESCFEIDLRLGK